MDWRKCSDRLPEKPNKMNYEQVQCLCYVKNVGVMVQLWNCEHLVWDDEDGDDVSHYNSSVTHWMPLPAPPTD